LAFSIALCLILASASPALQAAELAGRVVNVFSGVQIELLSEQKARFPIRLQGIALIDTRTGPMRSVQRRLNGLIGGRFVQVSASGERQQGSLLGFVSWGGAEINLRLVQEGLAQVVAEQLDAARLALYQRQEQDARLARRGHWLEQAARPSLLPQ
jgi:endonuclease YncB( thermonuclease family)